MTVSVHIARLSRCKLTRGTRRSRLEVLEWFRSRDILVFIMYYAYVMFRPSLLIGSTDPMMRGRHPSVQISPSNIHYIYLSTYICTILCLSVPIHLIIILLLLDDTGV